MQNFRALGAQPPDPHASGGWGICLQTPRLPKQPLATRLTRSEPLDVPKSMLLKIKVHFALDVQ